MARLFLFCAPRADIAGLLARAARDPAWHVGTQRDGAYAITTADGIALPPIRPVARHWVALTGFPDDVALACAGVDRWPMFAARILLTGPAATAAAGHTWWGPDPGAADRVMRIDSRLQIRADARFDVTPAAAERSEGPSLVAHFTPATGEQFCPHALRTLLESAARAARAIGPAHDPLAAALHGPWASDPG